MNKIIGATYKKNFLGYGVWEGKVVSYVPLKNAFECVYKDGFIEYNTLKKLIRCNVSKIPPTPITKKQKKRKLVTTSTKVSSIVVKKTSIEVFKTWHLPISWIAIGLWALYWLIRFNVPCGGIGNSSSRAPLLAKAS